MTLRLIALATLTATPAIAAEFSVTTVANEGPGSLRAALEASSQAAGVDVITFETTGTIQVDDSPLPIGSGVEIRGPDGEGITFALAAGYHDKMFVIAAGDEAVTFFNLKFSGTGSRKGAIYAEERTITLDHVTFDDMNVDNAEDNSGSVLEFDGNFESGYSIVVRDSIFRGCYANFGGVFYIVHFGGTLLIENSTFSDNNSMNQGGAIYFDVYADGSGTIRGSSFTGHSASSGAVLQVSGLADAARRPSLLIESSTISGNDSAGDSLIEVFQTNTRFYNVTVANNVTEGAPIAFSGLPPFQFLVESSTIAGNLSTVGFSGGFHAVDGTPVHFSNSIIAANTGQDVGAVDYADLSGTYTASHSIIERPGLNPMNLEPNDYSGQADVITGQPPQLGTLADNGGRTLTMVPAATSPAVNAGDSTNVANGAVDQRGEPRLQGPAIDIGAVETNVGASSNPDPDGDPDDTDPDASDPGATDAPTDNAKKDGGCTSTGAPSLLVACWVGVSLVLRRRR